MRLLNMRRIGFFILGLLLFLPVIVSGQAKNELSLVTSKGTSRLPVYERQGIIYFSIKHFADFTDASYYINDETKKFELKYSHYHQKITGPRTFTSCPLLLILLTIIFSYLFFIQLKF
jgi:hypothetical protein